MRGSIENFSVDAAAELSHLAPLRSRLAAVLGIEARALLPVRGFGHAQSMLLRLPKDEAGGRSKCASLAVCEMLGEAEAASLLCERPDAVFLLDERSIDWASKPSLVSYAARISGLFVYREIGAEAGPSTKLCGMLIGAPALIDRLSAALDADFLHPLIVAEALKALAPERLLIREARLAARKAERARIVERLHQCSGVRKIIDRDGPAIFAEALDADAVSARASIFEANVSRLNDGIFRIEIGEAAANDRVLAAFGADPARRAPRIGEVLRETRETRIAVRVDLDRAGDVRIATGIGYLDHMLEQIAAHGGISMTLACEGDLHVDLHHTIEDCALALGAALSKALGERRGIARYGFTLPMDEAEARVSIDLGGRPYAVFEGAFAAPLIGAYPTEMTAHVFRSLAQSLGAAIHVSVKGENDHHKTEACYKAFGRALRAAFASDSDAIPSTKGVIG